jgi:DNA-damage-inducible protein D
MIEEEAKEKLSKKLPNSGFHVENHFREITKMVGVGSGAKREVANMELTQYACYLLKSLFNFVAVN